MVKVSSYSYITNKIKCDNNRKTILLYKKINEEKVKQNFKINDTEMINLSLLLLNKRTKKKEKNHKKNNNKIKIDKFIRKQKEKNRKNSYKSK